MTGTARVLVVDDDEGDFILLREMFASRADRALGNIELVHASSVAQGMALLADGDIDLLIVDYRLGEETGLDFVLEAERAGVFVPALLVTGQGEMTFTPLAESLMDQGCLRFLHKGDLSWSGLEKCIRALVVRLMRVLFVSVSPDGVALARRSLAAGGFVEFEVETVDDPQAAAEIMAEKDVDVLILGAGMSEELRSQLVSASERAWRPPFLFLCADSESGGDRSVPGSVLDAARVGVLSREQLAGPDLSRYLVGASRHARLVPRRYRTS